ncbi:cation diffusion facilitator family transporter [Mesobacillus campisalis]|uniref:cation diffusion facilitator family transporter n=1 Tax=Mesobacillus campisalis TaxID=1408103 RepID=UPI000B0E5A99|nr:cation transporter [Mesobacillus campisalis]
MLYQYKVRLAKKLNSSALMAEAWHHRSDAISSIAAFVGVLGAILGASYNIPILVYPDPLAGLLVSLLVIKIGFSLAKEASSTMMEQVLDAEKTQPFIETAAKIPGVKRVMNYWPEITDTTWSSTSASESTLILPLNKDISSQKK